jgi:hypothetical protein
MPHDRRALLLGAGRRGLGCRAAAAAQHTDGARRPPPLSSPQVAAAPGQGCVGPPAQGGPRRCATSCTSHLPAQPHCAAAAARLQRCTRVWRPCGACGWLLISLMLPPQVWKFPLACYDGVVQQLREVRPAEQPLAWRAALLGALPAARWRPISPSCQPVQAGHQAQATSPPSADQQSPAAG